MRSHRKKIHFDFLGRLVKSQKKGTIFLTEINLLDFVFDFFKIIQILFI